MDECPLCGSPQPHLHPAVQAEGEVSTCPHDFHLTPTPQNRPEYIASVIEEKLAMDAPSLATIERIAKAFGNHDDFPCPFCGHRYTMDAETCSAVVSYWGDEPHDFSCSSCGKDFIVKERVTRQFETAKTIEDFD